MVGVDGNAPRALTSLPSGTVLQTAVVGNTHILSGGNSRNRTYDHLRMKEVHYRCAMLPLNFKILWGD